MKKLLFILAAFLLVGGTVLATYSTDKEPGIADQEIALVNSVDTENTEAFSCGSHTDPCTDHTFTTPFDENDCYQMISTHPTGLGYMTLCCEASKKQCNPQLASTESNTDMIVGMKYKDWYTVDRAIELGLITKEDAELFQCTGEPPTCPEGQCAKCVFNVCPLVTCLGYEWRCVPEGIDN